MLEDLLAGTSSLGDLGFLGTISSEVPILMTGVSTSRRDERGPLLISASGSPRSLVSWPSLLSAACPIAPADTKYLQPHCRSPASASRLFSDPSMDTTQSRKYGVIRTKSPQGSARLHGSIGDTGTLFKDVAGEVRQTDFCYVAYTPRPVIVGQEGMCTKVGEANDAAQFN